MTDVEDAIRRDDVDEDIQNNIRLRVVNIITNYVRNGEFKRKKGKLTRRLLQLFISAKNFLKANRDKIVVIKADKGGSTVVMNKNEYEEKMNTLLSNLAIYEPFNVPSTLKSLMTKNKQYVEDLFEVKVINNFEMKKMITNNAVVPKIYGVPKVLKIGQLPLRPVVATYDSPCYGLTRFLSNIFNNALNDDDNII